MSPTKLANPLLSRCLPNSYCRMFCFATNRLYLNSNSCISNWGVQFLSQASLVNSMVFLMVLTPSSVEVRLIPIINFHFSWNRCSLDISSTHIFPRIGVSVKLASASVARIRSIEVMSIICKIWHCVIYIKKKVLIFCDFSLLSAALFLVKENREKLGLDSR